jgi:hypothetical protein
MEPWGSAGYSVLKLAKILVLIVLANVLVPAVNAQSNSTEVNVTLLGQVEKTCTIVAPAGQVELNANSNNFGGDLATAKTKLFQVPMSCNAPFKVTMQSSNGALVHSGASGSSGTGQSGVFTESVPYALGWSVPLDNGATGQVSNCASVNLVNSPGCELTTNYSAINKVMQTSVSWTAPSAPLLAGNFQDTITIRLSAVDW